MRDKELQIQSILQAMPASGVVPESQTKSGAQVYDILSNALQEAQQTEAVNDENTSVFFGRYHRYPYCTTQAKKAELSLNLAIQIRNKVIDAYKRMMRCRFSRITAMCRMGPPCGTLLYWPLGNLEMRVKGGEYECGGFDRFNVCADRRIPSYHRGRLFFHKISFR